MEIGAEAPQPPPLHKNGREEKRSFEMEQEMITGGEEDEVEEGDPEEENTGLERQTEQDLEESSP